MYPHIGHSGILPAFRTAKSATYPAFTMDAKLSRNTVCHYQRRTRCCCPREARLDARSGPCGQGTQVGRVCVSIKGGLRWKCWLVRCARLNSLGNTVCMLETPKFVGTREVLHKNVGGFVESCEIDTAAVERVGVFRDGGELFIR